MTRYSCSPNWDKSKRQGEQVLIEPSSPAALVLKPKPFEQLRGSARKSKFWKWARTGAMTFLSLIQTPLLAYQPASDPYSPPPWEEAVVEGPFFFALDSPGPITGETRDALASQGFGLVIGKETVARRRGLENPSDLARI